jgi:hypothetical protein
MLQSPPSEEKKGVEADWHQGLAQPTSDNNHPVHALYEAQTSVVLAN